MERRPRSGELETKVWHQVFTALILTFSYQRLKFTILKHVIQDGDGVIWGDCNPDTNQLVVRVNRYKIVSHGKPSIGRMLCKINIWHSTADVNACRPLYEALSAVDGEHEIWRQIVASNREPKWKFVQPNTYLKDDDIVGLREYEASNVDIIQSFAERDL